MTVTRPALGKLYPLAKGLRGNQRRDAKKHWVSSGHSGDPADVRFTPESRRMQRTSLCPLWAKSGHPNIYSIISSARACIDGGTLIASALAVLRLMTNSNFVACTTGNSAGLSPLSTLPV